MPVKNLLVVNTPSRWKLPLDSVEVVAARDYLTATKGLANTGARVFNLCRSYAYQSIGYYVSLLAEARGHRAIPSVATLRDFSSIPVVRSLGEEIDQVIQSTLRKQTGKAFELPVYFGQTLDKAFSRMGSLLYRLFPAPLLRAQFTFDKRWHLASVSPLPLRDIPENERERIEAFAQAYFSKKQQPKPLKNRFLYDLAILLNPDDDSPPSNPRAVEKFTESAREVGFYVETIRHTDSDRISEFDALFIRETTAVDHPSYRLSRLAHAEGLIVIDDPWSILRSANKIYLSECLSRSKLPAPHTWILTRQDLTADRLTRVQFPCVLKAPDAAFSRGVHKVDNLPELRERLENLFTTSELVLAQEFVPSEYDWRIGILDNQPLYACKYFMARNHWQIYNWSAEKEDDRSGVVHTMHVELAPKAVVETALKAARLIGDGLYGVDLKQVGHRILVIEVNDNPSIDASIEDRALGQELYRRIALSFRRRIEQARGG